MREEDRGVGGNSVHPHDLTSFIATLTGRCFPIWIHMFWRSVYLLLN